MSNPIRKIVLTGAATLFLAAPLAIADNDWGWGRGMMGRWFMNQMMSDDFGPGMGPGMMMGGRFTDRWLDSAKVELKITDAQTKLWTDYVTAAKNSSETMVKLHQQMMGGNIPEKLPDRLALHESMMSARLEGVKSTNQALLALYNAMTKEQQDKADSMFTGMGMM